MQAAEQAFTKHDTERVKGLAILLMMIHHCFLDPARYEGKTVSFAPFPEGAFNAFALAMKICVGLFTFLSAYGITMSFKKAFPDGSFTGKEAGNVIKKRLVSLLGGYVFVFLLVQLWDLIVVRDGRYFKIYGHGLRSVLYFLIDLSGLAEMFSTPTYLATFWYMSLAVTLIILMPVLLKFRRHFGSVVLLFCAALFKVLFPGSKGHHFMYLQDYLFCMALGVCAAQQNLIIRMDQVRLTGKGNLDKILRGILAFFLTLILIFGRQKTRSTLLLPIWDGLIPLVVCFWIRAASIAFPIPGKVLQVLGKYSMNIFLIHNFIRIVWYYDFTYYFRFWWLITIVLLSVSFVISFLIEQLKHLLRYQKLLDCIIKITQGHTS